MYEAFYGFKEKPFSLLPDPDFLFPSKKHHTAITMLQYGLMNQAGFTVISGDVGAGKTTLIRHLLNQIDDSISVGLISNTHSSRGDLLSWVLVAFGIKASGASPAEQYHLFVDYVVQQFASNRRTVLIIDEAQNLNVETLEELRMLSNINADKNTLLQIVLVGQPELRDTLSKPELIQFAQRIAVDFHLGPLEKHETVAYIHHRLSMAGGEIGLFSDQACELIHCYASGVPRIVNLLCDTSLVYGYAAQDKKIDVDIVGEVVRDKEKGGLLSKFKVSDHDERVNPVG